MRMRSSKETPVKRQTGGRRFRHVAALAGAATGLGVVMAGLLFALGSAESAPAKPAGAASAGAAGAAAANDQVETQTEAPTTNPNVRITFKITPQTNATVQWGNKKLGLIKPKQPLTIERPRDSGPMDVVVKSQGFLNVHTRAYTFSNNTVLVKLTPLDKKNTVYGYREEIPPEADGGAPGESADAGSSIGTP